jgi:hypothetical protein
LNNSCTGYDFEYIEGLLNYDTADNSLLMNNYSFCAGDIVMSIDNEQSTINNSSVSDNSHDVINNEQLQLYEKSHFIEQSQLYNEQVHIQQMNDNDNSSVFDEHNIVDNSSVFDEYNAVDNSSVFDEHNAVDNSSVFDEHNTVDNSSVFEQSSSMIDNTQLFEEEIAVIDNSQMFEQSESLIDSSYSFTDNSVVNTSAVLGGKTPVTVNFNAYNEFNSSPADVDSVLTAFSDKLAQAVSHAAQGLHF